MSSNEEIFYLYIFLTDNKVDALFTTITITIQCTFFTCFVSNSNSSVFEIKKNKKGISTGCKFTHETPLLKKNDNDDKFTFTQIFTHFA